ncbi:MAG: histidine phosphatase family protein [Rhodocyclaceae bacterium]|nr:histidine phosphatase family protein [Rhodocyclaceae bacterium]
MDLILWRHAEAIDGIPDFDRPLSERGQQQARRVAKWLDKNRPRRLRVIASPTVRTRMTAEAFTSEFEVDDRLATQGGVTDILSAAGWPDESGAVLVVGHQPTLGRVAALLLAGAEADWTVKKGALWWFTNRVRHGETQTVLRAVLTADLA